MSVLVSVCDVFLQCNAWWQTGRADWGRRRSANGQDESKKTHQHNRPTARKNTDRKKKHTEGDSSSDSEEEEKETPPGSPVKVAAPKKKKQKGAVEDHESESDQDGDEEESEDRHDSDRSSDADFDLSDEDEDDESEDTDEEESRHIHERLNLPPATGKKAKKKKTTQDRQGRAPRPTRAAKSQESDHEAAKTKSLRGQAVDEGYRSGDEGAAKKLLWDVIHCGVQPHLFRGPLLGGEGHPDTHRHVQVSFDTFHVKNPSLFLGKLMCIGKREGFFDVDAHVLPVFVCVLPQERQRGSSNSTDKHS